MATKAEILQALRNADAAGDTEAAQRLAQMYQNTPDEQPQPEQPQDTGNPAMNALYGFAARGNQAMAALNPWADQQKIAAEQEWVKQHPGAGAGTVLADMAITAPAGGFGGPVARSIGSGLIESFTTPGDAKQRADALNYGTLGAGAGEGIANTLGFLIKPFTKPNSAFSDVTDILRSKANGLGIKLNAAQETGNKTLQYVDSALDFIPSSSSMQQANKLEQRRAWQEALFKAGHEQADAATPEAMAAMKGRISGEYTDLGSRYDITVDQQLKDSLDAIASQRNLDRMDVNKRGIIQSYLDEFNVPTGSTFSGSGYQGTRSQLKKQADGMKGQNPLESQSLSDIRSAIDDAMGRSVSPEDAARWKQANNDWAVMKNIEGATDPTTGFVSSDKLMSTLARKEKNRVIYGKGDQDLTDIAKVGKEFISNKTPDSGTAQRQAMIKMLTGAGVAGTAGDFAYSKDPESAALGGIGTMAASVLLPRQAAKMMWKPGGYLSKGLLDMSQQALPGLSRDELMRYALRGGLLGVANDSRQ